MVINRLSYVPLTGLGFSLYPVTTPTYKGRHLRPRQPECQCSKVAKLTVSFFAISLDACSVESVASESISLNPGPQFKVTYNIKTHNSFNRRLAATLHHLVHCN